MARERIIVKEAINALRYLLNQLMKSNDDLDTSLDRVVLNSNLFSFALRFLRYIGKIGNIVDELASKLRIIGDYLMKNFTNEHYYGNSSSASEQYCRLYELFIYPLARILEALGTYNMVIENNSSYNRSYNRFVNDIISVILDYLRQEEVMIYLFDSNQKFVPIVQGMLSVANKVSEKSKRDDINITLLKIKELAIRNDPEMNSIATQDVFYLIKLKSGEILSNNEIKPLILNLKSKVFKRVLKGIEYLTMFGMDPPQNSVDYILGLMPRFFSEIFRVGNSHNTFIYYSSIAESIHNILNYYNNKAFAQAMMNYLIEDTGWIARNNYSYVDFIKTVIGTSLLIQARGAIRR